MTDMITDGIALRRTFPCLTPRALAAAAFALIPLAAAILTREMAVREWTYYEGIGLVHENRLAYRLGQVGLIEKAAHLAGDPAARYDFGGSLRGVDVRFVSAGRGEIHRIRDGVETFPSPGTESGITRLVANPAGYLVLASTGVGQVACANPLSWISAYTLSRTRAAWVADFPDGTNERAKVIARAEWSRPGEASGQCPGDDPRRTRGTLLMRFDDQP